MPLQNSLSKTFLAKHFRHIYVRQPVDKSWAPRKTSAVRLLERAEGLAKRGRLDDRTRAELWAFAADGPLSEETVHRLVELDTAKRKLVRQAAKRAGARSRDEAKREEARIAWAHPVPWALRGNINLPLATWGVFGMLIARASERGAEWQAEISQTEIARRLGNASRHTVVAAVERLEDRGFVRAIRRRRNPRFNEVNVYVLEHPQAVQAAARTPWREEGPAGQQAVSDDPEGSESRRGASLHATPISAFSNSAPPCTHIHPKEETDSTKLQKTSKQPCSSLQDKKRGGTTPKASSLAELSGKRPAHDPPDRRESPPDLSDGTAQALATQLATGLGVPYATDHWQMAEALLANQLVGFDRRAWRRACAHHGPRAALAVIETALVVRIRGGTDNPIRSAPAYLGGILRKRRGDCRPELTLAALAAAAISHQREKETER